MIKAVLFDMDGTVLDTEPMYKKAWKAAFEREGYEFNEELFNKCVGLSVALCKKLINETYGDSGLFDKTFPVAASWVYNYKKANGIPIKAGFVELSDYLRDNGVKSVIATSTSHNAAVEDLTYSGIIDRFDGIVGGDDTENGKPFPDPYIKAAELAGVGRDECIAVEDSKNGITSAHSAGIRCVYAKDFLEVPSETEEKAFRKVKSLKEIINIIKEEI
ncbi:MAG: HAD family phosphatase [Oscillospiraceae bacterium]|jgi:beta-phosphoglucomutase-like phosphatase (HAD superfamily)|nr:HAD family phosphatase [Oscillospiraceae bacterium]